MSPEARELLHLVLRWVHLIAGIMWIGNSMLFNWLDRNLEMPPNPKKGLVGEIWMLHSGAFYQVEKKFLEPAQMPKNLHWFMYQNLTTWVSGMCLLLLVFHMDAAAMMVDPAVSSIAPERSVTLSLATIVGSFLCYDFLWRSRIGKHAPTVAFVLSGLVVLFSSYLFFAYLSGRAAYIHVGVVLGSWMTGNVWFVIVPSQKELVAATREGREQDREVSYQAKQRSIHNNYMTFPLLFIMLSGHFPSTFGHKLNWLMLIVLCVGSALIRHLMNIRFGWVNWLLVAIPTFVTTVLLAFFLMKWQTFQTHRATELGPPVPFTQVQQIVQQRCTTCHSAHPTDATFRLAPNGVMFDTPDQIQRQAERIRVRAVDLRTMPLANMTHITDDERNTLGRWIAQGARVTH